jgi:hypothetical protein
MDLVATPPAHRAPSLIRALRVLIALCVAATPLHAWSCTKPWLWSSGNFHAWGVVGTAMEVCQSELTWLNQDPYNIYFSLKSCDAPLPTGPDQSAPDAHGPSAWMGAGQPGQPRVGFAVVGDR